MFNQVNLTLPMPPSVNELHAVNWAMKRQYCTGKYNTWKSLAAQACFNVRPTQIDIPVKVTYEFGKPDRRRRDVENYAKATSDFLTTQKYILDDSLIDHMTLLWTDEHPRVVHVKIEPMMRAGA